MSDSIHSGKHTLTSFVNPVCASSADPWVIKRGSCYYYCYSTGNGVAVQKMSDISKLGSASGSTVYTAPSGKPYSAEYWAPELHYLDGEWYIYVAADDGDNVNHRMYVLRGTSQDPTDPFVFAGKITDKTDKWAIDGTVLEYGGEMYFVWSGWEGDVNVAQNIYIARMSDPCTIASDRVLLSAPEYDWECIGRPLINEGPAALLHTASDGRVTAHIVYSASGSWTDDYCLGMLTYRGGDILSPASWTKSAAPVFSKTENAYGPGHCSFTVGLDGTDYIVYHASLTPNTNWGKRGARIQSFTWDGDMPVFGTPAQPNQEIPLAVCES